MRPPMFKMNVNDNGVYIDVTDVKDREQSEVPPHTVSVSDPSNTVIYDPNARTLRPNGTNNTGTVAVTVTDLRSGIVRVENLMVVASSFRPFQIDLKASRN